MLWLLALDTFSEGDSFHLVRRPGRPWWAQVALVGPTDPLATGLGALVQGRGPGGLDSLVLEALAPDSPDHGLGGLGGVLGPPSPDSFPAYAGQARGGSLMNIE